MAGKDGEKDHIPMLSGSHQRDVEMRLFTSRSNSMFVRGAGARRKDSAAASSSSWKEEEEHQQDNFMFHTGPLQRGPAAAQFVPMSGPLYTPNRAVAPLPPPDGRTPRSKPPAVMPEEKTGMGGGEWTGANGGYGSNVKNVHLLMSGPLGLCNDPYCTTCPAAYRAKVAPPALPPRKLYRVPSPRNRI